MAFAKQKAPERKASKCAILYGIRKPNYTGVFLRLFLKTYTLDLL